MERTVELWLWFDYNEAGEISRLGRINVVPAKQDIKTFFEDYFKPPFGGGGVTRVAYEHIVIPETLMGIDGTAAVLYVHDKRFRAVLPYFTVMKP